MAYLLIAYNFDQKTLLTTLVISLCHFSIRLIIIRLYSLEVKEVAELDLRLLAGTLSTRHLRLTLGLLRPGLDDDSLRLLVFFALYSDGVGVRLFLTELLVLDLDLDLLLRSSLSAPFIAGLQQLVWLLVCDLHLGRDVLITRRRRLQLNQVFSLDFALLGGGDDLALHLDVFGEPDASVGCAWGVAGRVRLSTTASCRHARWLLLYQSGKLLFARLASFLHFRVSYELSLCVICI